MSSPSDFRWYTLQTLSNNESKVKRLLDKAIKDEEMGDFVAEILMPVKTVKDFRNGKKRESEMKLYPSYLFVRARLFDDEGTLLEAPWSFLRKTAGNIDKIDADRGKLEVSVDIFGRSTPVELEFWQVERDDRD